MVYRNGMIADTLRKAGLPYKIIFGLQLPQIAAIARALPNTVDLADELWADNEVRESRLLACYLYPLEQIDEDKATKLAESVRTPEEADILCFRLLRYYKDAEKIALRLSATEDPLLIYCGKALRRNLDAL